MLLSDVCLSVAYIGPKSRTLTLTLHFVVCTWLYRFWSYSFYYFVFSYFCCKHVNKRSVFSITERPRKTKIGTEVAHVTRDSDTTFKKGQRSRSPGRFTHRRVGTPGSYGGGHRNVLAVRNCCYVAVCSAVLGASAPTWGGEGRGI